MTRFLVDAPDTVAGQEALEHIREQLHSDGHVATAVDDESDLLAALRAADAVIAVLDGEAPAAAGALLAYATTQHKPTLGFVRAGTNPPRILRHLLSRQEEGERVTDWLAALPAFYDQVRPFAGRLVRDFIPDLVKEAGHAVTFRSLTADEKPHFLKEKVLAEAAQLRDADSGNEKEEIADVLETLETLIRARGYDRESLKQVKDAKRKRRGGFEKGWVVEETQASAAALPKDGGTAPSELASPPTNIPDPTTANGTDVRGDETTPSFTL
jgi:predicted house-cleaning noncanonical NTP pyrophosphatase (MazG superfamily)